VCIDCLYLCLLNREILLNYGFYLAVEVLIIEGCAFADAHVVKYLSVSVSVSK